MFYIKFTFISKMNYGCIRKIKKAKKSIIQFFRLFFSFLIIILIIFIILFYLVSLILNKKLIIFRECIEYSVKKIDFLFTSILTKHGVSRLYFKRM